MITILLQRAGNNWLPLLLPLIAIVALAKGTQMLIHFVKARKERRRQLSITNYDGVMDELMGQDTNK